MLPHVFAIHSSSYSSKGLILWQQPTAILASRLAHSFSITNYYTRSYRDFGHEEVSLPKLGPQVGRMLPNSLDLNTR